MLESLISLAKQSSAKFQLTVESDHTVTASWKVPGHKAEVVTGRYTDVRVVLAELLKRLGLYRDVPTNDFILDRLTPEQGARLRVLLEEVRQIKLETQR